MTVPESIIKNFGENNPLEPSLSCGSISLQNGKLYLSEWYDVLDMPALAPVFPWEHASVYFYKEAETEAVAYAEIRFSDNTVAEWEMLRWKGQEEAVLEEGEIFGIPVFSGLISVCSENFISECHRLLSEGIVADVEELYGKILLPSLEKSKTLGGCAKIIRPKTFSDTMIIFESGYGEGFYGGYLAKDSEGIPVKVIIECIELIV